jgi:hypothetical protein
MTRLLSALGAFATLALLGTAAIAQQYKYETPMPPGCLLLVGLFFASRRKTLECTRNALVVGQGFVAKPRHRYDRPYYAGANPRRVAPPTCLDIVSDKHELPSA